MDNAFTILDNFFETEHTLGEAVQELVHRGIPESDAKETVYEYTKHVKYVDFDEHP